MMLIELLMALFLTALLMLGLVQMVSTSSSASLLQENQARLLDQLRFVSRLVTSEIAQAGFRPLPWDEDYAISAIGESTQDGVSASGDRLVLRRWSNVNCFDNRNPVADAGGMPAYHLRETEFDINTSGQLTRTCRYGPSGTELTTQVRRQGLVPGVRAFQLLFGEDSDGNGQVDRWVTAGGWGDEARVLGIRVGLILRGEDAVVENSSQAVSLLDTRMTIRNKGRLHQALVFSSAIRGRQG